MPTVEEEISKLRSSRGRDTRCAVRLLVSKAAKRMILKWVGITRQGPHTRPFSFQANASGVTMEKILFTQPVSLSFVRLCIRNTTGMKEKPKHRVSTSRWINIVRARTKLQTTLICFCFVVYLLSSRDIYHYSLVFTFGLCRIIEKRGCRLQNEA